MEIRNAIILNKPTVNTSSDHKYFKDIISESNDTEINFRYKLIDEDQFFTVKFLVLHPRDITPEISPIGKISGLNRIEVATSIESNAELINNISHYPKNNYKGPGSHLSATSSEEEAKDHDPFYFLKKYFL